MERKITTSRSTQSACYFSEENPKLLFLNSLSSIQSILVEAKVTIKRKIQLEIVFWVRQVQ
jgi:hypothetical protein